ncbi:MAG TPA: VLRF1 family aeRF1-type release factor [Gaiellaceae bacterium]|nr:VLRF1 family aeRF1-type release factor [Gaiellaceae bacterium]
MESSLIEHAAELRDAIDGLAQLRDEVGVLSITVGIEPGPVLGERPAWEVALENDLARLARNGARGRAVERWLAGANGELERLVDAARSGRGRALYVALGTGASTELCLQPPLPTGARLGDLAHVLPLLAALDAGEPAAFLVASRDELALHESELGTVHELDRIELEPWVGSWWPEMKAPARANPLRGQEMVSHRDRYARRVAAAYRRTLDEAVREVVARAGERGWTRAVLAGDPRRTEPLEEALREAGVATVVLDATLAGVPEEDARRRLRTALEGLVASRALELAREAKAEAAADGRGACGLADVLAALGEGRVARLLIDPARVFPGTVGPGEVLRAAVPPEEGVDLTDRIVARALATDAAVTPLSGEAAAVLQDREGIGALLRW